MAGLFHDCFTVQCIFDGHCYDLVYSDDRDEDVEMPEMVEPQKVFVMLPRDPHNRSAVGSKAPASAGVMQGQAPGEFCVHISRIYFRERKWRTDEQDRTNISSFSR